MRAVARTAASHVVRLVAVVLGVTTMLFGLSRLAGNPAELYAPPAATQEMIDASAARMGLDRPLGVQFLDALTAPFRLDFGNSYLFEKPVLEIALQRIGPSLLVIVLSLVVAAAVALVVGLIAALKPTRWQGRLVMLTSYVMQAVPYFWMSAVLVLLFGIRWKILPATGSDGWKTLVIPVATLGLFGYATLARLVRGQLLDVFRQDFVVTARSKGIGRRRIVLQHALPVASPPLLAWLGIQFAFMMGSLLVLEPLLNRQGLGSLLVQAVTNRDFPIVQVCVVLVAVVITTVNAALDIVVRVIDPRVAAGVRR